MHVCYIKCSNEFNIHDSHDCSYLAVSDLTERTFLSGEGVHVHPMHPPPPLRTRLMTACILNCSESVDLPLTETYSFNDEMELQNGAIL